MPLIFTQPYFYTAISNPLAGSPVNTKYTNVSLLMHFDGVWTDSSLYAAGNLAAYGNLAFSPTNPKFGSHSLYFDGNGGYAQYANSPQYSFGTGDFTIEAWIYPESLVGTNGASTIVTGLSTNSDGGGYDRWVFYILSNGSLSFANGESAGAANQFSVSSEAGIIATNKWQHVAVTRSNGVMQFFVDGVTKPVVSKNGMPESVAVTSNGPLRFGRLFNGSSWTFQYKGYMDEVRITKGAARYTTDYDVPTAAFANEPTALMMHFDGEHNSTVFKDECSSAVTRVGAPVISTGSSMFGGASGYFSGNGDYLVVPSSPKFNFGTGDFTIEFWIRPATVSKSYHAIFDMRVNGIANDVKPQIQLNGATLTYWVGTSQRIIGSALSAGTWYHIALCRKGGVTRMFVNGTKVGSDFADANNYLASDIVIGALGDNRSYPAHFNGYMDELRVTKGVGYYDSNFTAPTAPF